jgi:hypothetical protein
MEAGSFGKVRNVWVCDVVKLFDASPDSRTEGLQLAGAVFLFVSGGNGRVLSSHETHVGQRHLLALSHP